MSGGRDSKKADPDYEDDSDSSDDSDEDCWHGGEEEEGGSSDEDDDDGYDDDDDDDEEDEEQSAKVKVGFKGRRPPKRQIMSSNVDHVSWPTTESMIPTAWATRLLGMVAERLLLSLLNRIIN